MAMKKKAAFTSARYASRKTMKKASPMTVGRRTYTGSYVLEDLMKRSADVKSQTKISDREISIMLKKAMDSGKYRNIANPVKRAAQEALKNSVNNAMPTITKYGRIPFHRIGMELLNRVSSDTGSTDPKASPKVMEFSIAPPLLRDLQKGKMYFQKVHIDEGKRSKQFEDAISLYGVKTYPFYCTGSKGVFDAQYSQAGINRKGIYAPIKGMTQSGSEVFSNWIDRYEASGTVQKAFIRTFINEYGLSSAVRGYMQEVNTGNLDIKFPIVGTTSIHRIRNKMEFTPIDVSIYILRCKHGITEGPWANILPAWQLSPNALTTDNKHCPVNSSEPDSDTFQRTWLFPIEEATIQQDSEIGAPESATFNVESSTRLGVTPAWSPTFNKFWSICDVRKQRLDPADILEFHFDQSFQSLHSLRDLIAEFGNYTTAGRNTYKPGDYELLITFQGIPGYCEGVPTTNTLEVDALKSRISKTVEHRIKYAWPTLATGNPDAATEPDELRKNGWLTSTVRTAMDSRRTESFTAGYNAKVVTDQTIQTGGPI